MSEYKEHEVLKALHLTEQSYEQVENSSTFIFKIPRDANKTMVREAVKKAFDVRVVSVNTSVTNGKTRSVRRQPGRKTYLHGFKKAFVKVHPEDISKIPLI